MRARALVIGLLLIPVNALWLGQMEMGAAGSVKGTTSVGPYPSSLSLFANVICFLLALGAANALVRRRRPAWTLTQADLLVVYVMLTIGTCVISIDFIDVLMPMLTHATRYATPSNGWQTLFMPHMPSWAHVTDASAVKQWYEGGANPYAGANLVAWLKPLTAWGTFIVALFGAMLCLNVLVRRRWTTDEKLSFPVIQLPLEMTEPSGALYRNPRLWAGFSVAAGVSLLNGLAVLFPNVPSLPIKAQDLSPYFPARPWNAMGWTPLAFYPFAIGLGFLLPVDLLFSSWFFCLMWRGERILSAAYGWTEFSPTFPYVNEQCFGAYMAVAGIAVWGVRRQLAAALRLASGADAGLSARELRTHRLAAAGAMVAIAYAAAFFHALGLPWWMCVVSFVIYFAIAIACTRMRAELGPPAHDLHNGGPDYILAAVMGTRSMSAQTLTALTWFWWFNRAYRSIAMPYQLEAWKLCERRRMSVNGMAVAMGLATIVGIISGFWALHYLGYRNGVETRMAGHFPYFGWEAFNRLSGWIQSPRDTDLPALAAIAVGTAGTVALQLARMRIGWWPFHPLGLAVSGSFTMSTLWAPMLIAWVAKVCVLRFGGLRSYRSAMPFFLGLILGDYVVGCAWPLVGLLLKTNTYSYYF